MKFVKYVLAASIFMGLSAQAKIPSIGRIQDSDLDTPLCDVRDRKNQTLFADQHDAGAFMIVNGQKKEFKLAEGRKSLWDFQTKGEKISTAYQSNGLTISFIGKVTDACEEDEEGCEVVNFKVNAKITNGTETIEIRNLTGGCGV